MKWISFHPVMSRLFLLLIFYPHIKPSFVRRSPSLSVKSTSHFLNMRESPGSPPRPSQLSLTQHQLNSSIHHAVPTITQRAVRDFGNKMVTESKHELISHFTAEALDEVADIIISKASDSFLDKCLEKRLLTIEAKPLINALAKAERLGYEPGDVIQDDRHERVIPHEAYPGASAAPNGLHGRPSQPPPAGPQASRSLLQCMKCFRTFAHSAAMDYVGMRVFRVRSISGADWV